MKKISIKKALTESEGQYLGKHDEYYLYYDHEELLGILGATYLDGSKVRVNGFVLPKKRRQGIFRALVAELCDRLKAQGVGLIQFPEGGFLAAIKPTFLNGFYEISPLDCDITAPVRGQLAAYNQGDIDAFMANYSEGCIVEDGAGNVLMTGASTMYGSYKKLFEASPDLHCHLVNRTILGEYILDEERVTGRAGSTGQSHVVAVYKIEGGLICHVRFLR